MFTNIYINTFVNSTEEIFLIKHDWLIKQHIWGA